MFKSINVLKLQEVSDPKWNEEIHSSLLSLKYNTWFTVYHLSKNVTKDGPIHKIGSRNKIDTGSLVNILPKQVYDTLQLSDKTRTIPSNSRLSAYGSLLLNKLGCSLLKREYKNTLLCVNYNIIGTDSSAILGLRQSLDFGL